VYWVLVALQQERVLLYFSYHQIIKLLKEMGFMGCANAESTFGAQW
jgi:hypothetical protein